MTQAISIKTRMPILHLTHSKTRVVSIVLGMVAALTSHGGCVAPFSLEPHRQSQSGVSSDSSSHGGLANAQAELRRIVPGDVITDLYLAMQDEPFDRATLAIALRTSQTLANDLKLRQHDAGSVSEKSRRRAVAWLENAIDRIGNDERPAPPSLASTDWNRWFSDTAEGQPASVFAFVDRVRTGGDRSRFGDFDLIISTGQPVYPMVSDTGGLAVGGRSLEQYARALDVGLIAFGGGRAQLASANASVIRAQTLRDMMARTGNTLSGGAITDAAAGETWGAMIARRALVRGATGQPIYDAIGISPPRGDRQWLAKRTRAAMWVQAIDGQRLGLVEGWHEARVHAGALFPSRLADPDWLEAVAHTSLEIRQHADLLAPFRFQRSLAIMVDANALAPQNPNAWSTGFTELADALVDWQIPFDIIVANRRVVTQRYEYKMRYKPGTDFSASRAAQEASRLLSKRAPELREIILVDDGGDPADGLYVRQSVDGRGLAVVNLTSKNRKLRMYTSSGGSASATFVDRVSGEKVRGRMALSPYAVRVLKRK